MPRSLLTEERYLPLILTILFKGRLLHRISKILQAYNYTRTCKAYLYSSAWFVKEAFIVHSEYS